MNGGVESKSHRARQREEAATNISKTIQVGVDRHTWLDPDSLRRLQVVASRRMDIQHRDQRCRIRELEGNLVCRLLLEKKKKKSNTKQDGWHSVGDFTPAYEGPGIRTTCA